MLLFRSSDDSGVPELLGVARIDFGDGVAALEGSGDGVAALEGFGDGVAALEGSGDGTVALAGSRGGVLALAGWSVHVTLPDFGGGLTILAFLVGPPAESASHGGQVKLRLAGALAGQDVKVLHATGASFFKANTWHGSAAFAGGAGRASCLSLPSGVGGSCLVLQGGGGINQPQVTEAGAMGFALAIGGTAAALGRRL